MLLSCAFLLCSGVVFRYPIFNSVVETYIGSKMNGYGGWKFSFQKIHLSRSSIVFSDVSLKTKRVGATVHVERLGLLFEKKKGISFSSSIFIEEPIIEVEKLGSQGEFALSSMMKGPLERYKVDVTDGLVKFVDAEGRVDIYFSLEGDRQRRSVGIFYLSEMPPGTLAEKTSPQVVVAENILDENSLANTSSNSLVENASAENMLANTSSSSTGELDASAMVKLYQWPKELIVESELENASLVWISRIVNFFQPNSLKDWTGLQGVVSGHSWIGFNRSGEILQTTANVEVESFSCQRASGDLELKVQELSLDFSFPSGGKKIEKREVWWQSLAMKSQVVGGVARFKDTSGGPILLFLILKEL